MKILLTLHHGLEAIGGLIGPLIIMALVLGLFIALVLAMLRVSLYAALGIADITGGGIWVVLPMFCIFIGLIGWYVSPHVQPQISGAMMALLKSD
jgi:hypothetical protein